MNETVTVALIRRALGRKDTRHLLPTLDAIRHERGAARATLNGLLTMYGRIPDDTDHPAWRHAAAVMAYHPPANPQGKL